jgi:hypothetical protein
MKSIHIRRLLAAAGMSLAPLLETVSLCAQELPSDMVVVRYALRLTDWKIVGSESYCRVGKECRLGFDFDPIRSTLLIMANGVDVVDIDCPGSGDGCEMQARETSHSYRHEKPWELFKLLMPIDPLELVYRPRIVVGAVLLNYRVNRDRLHLPPL